MISDAGEDEVLYSSQLTVGDLGKIRSFLTFRLCELTEALEPDSEAYFAASALTEIVAWDGERAAKAIGQLGMFSGRSGAGDELDCAPHIEAHFLWNRLVSIAARWEKHPDYSAQWSEIHYFNPQHFGYVKAQRAKAFQFT
ncbi:hypothetical protein ACFWFU_36060 [Streptomyces sp. NPDC060235]|uniref:hypothetical protein n=1 Tax=Streptomyces sp. NPDC060235 TaxID=3347080 RepID=UPI0036642028